MWGYIPVLHLCNDIALNLLFIKEISIVLTIIFLLQETVPLNYGYLRNKKKKNEHKPCCRRKYLPV